MTSIHPFLFLPTRFRTYTRPCTCTCLVPFRPRICMDPRMYSTNTGGPSVVHEGVCCCGGPHIWIGTKNSKEECARAVQADSRCKKHETGQFFSYKDMNRADENYRLCGCPTGDDMDCSQENMWHRQPDVTRIYRLGKCRGHAYVWIHVYIL